MALTPSTMLELGTAAPPFSLPNHNPHWGPVGKAVSLDDFADARAYLVMFICNHCPYVKHTAELLAAMGKEYQARDVAVIAINSNDVANYPDDSPEKMAEESGRWGWTFPYLFDEDQSVARAYAAACTPDVYVFDKGRRLVYRGQIDDSRPDSGMPATGDDLQAALDAALAGRPCPEPQKPSMGCNIKWKKGNAPDYA
jgi:thiol-disulfide isomerase/thioredoxin